MIDKINYKPIITIVGRPNVGKSTLFNRITGRRMAITSEIAGTTRDRLYENITLGEREFVLVDTAGMETEMQDELADDIRMQIDLALEEADFFIFVVDGQTGITPQDEAAAEKLRKVSKPTILVANKVDNVQIEKQIAEFYSLGLGEISAVSSIHGLGVIDMLDRLVEETKDIAGTKPVEEDEAQITVTLAGRPNVGKSSILNQIAGKKKVIVSDIPGTTRDINATFQEIGGTRIKFIDTAGIRRRGKIETGIEKFSALRSFKAIDATDITVLVIDAVEGIVAQDQHIAGFARDLGKGLIIVVNKWDAIEKDEKTMDRFLARLREEFSFAYWAPVVFVSALTGKNIDKIAPLILEVAAEGQKEITTGKLNSFIERITTIRQPGMKKGVRPKLFYATQTGTKPPTFTIFSSHPEMVHFSYLRYLENNFRDEFGFNGTPIKIILKKRS